MPSGWIGRPVVGVEASREGTGAAVPVIEAFLSSDGRINEVAVSVLVADEAVVVGSASVLDGEDGEKAADDDCSPKKELALDWADAAGDSTARDLAEEAPIPAALEHSPNCG